MALINQSAEKEWRCRHGEQMCGHSREWRGWDELVGSPCSLRKSQESSPTPQ